MIGSVDEEGIKRTRGLPDPSSVSLAVGINMIVVGCLVSDPIHSFLLSILSL